MTERQGDPRERDDHPGDGEPGEDQPDPSERESEHTEDPRRKDTGDQLPEETPEETNSARRYAGVLLILTACLAVLGCGTSTFDSRSLDRSITSQLESRGATSVSVSCPSGITVKKGGTFTCPVTVQGHKGTVRATETDTNGHFHYNVTFP